MIFILRYNSLELKKELDENWWICPLHISGGVSQIALQAIRVDGQPAVVKSAAASLVLDLQPGGLALALPKVVQLGAANLRGPRNLDILEGAQRGVDGETALHAHALHHLAHGHSAVQAGLVLRDDDALVRLHPRLPALLHNHAHSDFVADFELH